MEEVLLIIVLIASLVGYHFLLKRIKQPIRSYIRITMMIVLIVLAWWPDENRKLWETMLLSVIAIHGIWNEILELKKLNSKIEH